MSLQGRKIREWTLHEEIGRGAIGVIIRATHKFQTGEFAIKALRPERSRQDEIRERFFEEARTHAQLCHPNIVQTFPAFEEGRMLYLPMELLRGNSLRTLMRVRRSPFPPALAGAYAGQAALGLGCAHAHQVMHRDVKPGNLVVLEDGATVKIVDFGLARGSSSKRLTATGATVGTPNYLAPEVIDGDDATQKSDIYALGVVLFRMLTARLPFDAEWKPNSIRYAQSIRRAQAAGLSSVGDFVADVPEPIAGLCEAMLRIDPATRIDSPDEIARVLGTAVSAPPDWTRQIHPAAAQPRSTEIPEAGVRDDGEGTMPDRPSRLTTDAPVAKKRGAVSSLPAEDSDTEFIRGPGEK